MGCCCCCEHEKTEAPAELTGWAKVDGVLSAFCEKLENWRILLVSGVCVAIGLANHLKGMHMGYANPALVAVVLSGLPLAYEAFRTLFAERRITSALLITLAMIAALSIGETFAAGEVAFIMALGEKLEAFSVRRARKGVKSLVKLKELVNDKLKVGDIVPVGPGAAFPCDGEVIEGETTVDQSVITGESVPVRKVPGDSVFCGTLNRYGFVRIKARAVGGNSSLARTIRLVNEAEKHRAPIQRIADRWAAWLVPSALCVALLTFLAWFFCLDAGLPKALTCAVTVLVTFCPCALALATPTAIVAAIGQATKRGVLIKTGEALEKASRVDVVAFDKTGTLTTGTWANNLRRDQEGRILAGEKLDVADTLRPEAAETIADLKSLGVTSCLLTGDHAPIAAKFAALCGIEQVKADLLPEDKVNAVKELTARGAHVAMVGDGVNDAAAMKYASVGIAMSGAGTDIATEASDIAIMNDHLSSVAYVKRLAQACVRTIRFNITLSMTINFVAVSLGVTGCMTPVWGALVHNASSFLVVLNAALLYDRRIKTHTSQAENA